MISSINIPFRKVVENNRRSKILVVSTPTYVEKNISLINEYLIHQQIHIIK